MIDMGNYLCTLSNALVQNPRTVKARFETNLPLLYLPWSLLCRLPTHALLRIGSARLACLQKHWNQYLPETDSPVQGST